MNGTERNAGYPALDLSAPRSLSRSAKMQVDDDRNHWDGAFLFYSDGWSTGFWLYVLHRFFYHLWSLTPLPFRGIFKLLVCDVVWGVLSEMIAKRLMIVREVYIAPWSLIDSWRLEWWVMRVCVWCFMMREDRWVEICDGLSHESDPSLRLLVFLNIGKSHILSKFV